MDQIQTGGAIPDDARTMLTYDGKISELFGIFLLNLLLTVVTLGIFRFWAITRIRRYLWSHMRFEDTRFTYTGKGSPTLAKRGEQTEFYRTHNRRPRNEGMILSIFNRDKWLLLVSLTF